MEILFNRLFRIDIEKKDITPMPLDNEKTDLKNYIKELLDKILSNSDSKSFIFNSETTEIRVLINKIIKDGKNNTSLIDEATVAIANRLLKSEIVIQEKVTRLGVEVQKGILVISLVKYDNGNLNIVFSKAENDEFLEDITFKLRRGLPLRKKIYKAFICELNEQNQVNRISVYDTNSTISVYWWRDFLELKEIHNDEYNTKRAFDVIEANILNPIKSISSLDHITLWNSAIRYFRSEQDFSLENFIQENITNYEPYSEKVNTNKIATDLKDLPQKYNFDSRFTIVPKLITKRFKKIIPLTPQIDLQIKSDIQDIENIIRPHEELDGTKYVMIKSESGFNYFSKKK